MYTPEQVEFRAALCHFLSSLDTADAHPRRNGGGAGVEEGIPTVYRRLGERSWLAAGWPVEYGGLGLGLVGGAIVTEELALHGVPDLIHSLSVDIVGNLILRIGSEEQKKRHLGPLARGEISAAALYTEEHAGSDLSGLTTRAEWTDGCWRIHGRKVYSQKSQYASLALCAARVRAGGPTGLFLVPLDRGGPAGDARRPDGGTVAVRAMPCALADRFNEVVFDGTPADPLYLPDPGDPTTRRAVNDALDLERTGMEYQARAQRWLALARRAAAAHHPGDPTVSARLGELESLVRAAGLLSWRVVELMERGADVGHLAAGAKWLATDATGQVAEMCLETVGLDGVLAGSEPDGYERGEIELMLREAPAHTLSAGTSEVMLHIVSTVGLHL